MKFRNWLYIFFLFWFLAYTAMAVWVIACVDLEVWQAFGLGGVFGVFVKMISDGWQFYYRRAPSWENPDSEK